MDWIRLLTSNYVLNVAVAGWFSAQVIKTVIHAVHYKKFVPERMFGAGGMPSAHSATVCGLVTAVARCEGFDSPLFAIAAVVAMITMYDAMGVRRQAGMHARMLNILLRKDQEEHLEEEDDEESISEELQLKKNRYKEFLGHTPLQVLVGGILGVVMAFLMPMM